MGPGVDGRSQIVFVENRKWTGQIDFPAMDLKALGYAQSIGDQLRGRAGVLRVPVINIGTPRFLGDEASFYQSIGVSPNDVARGALAFDDGSTFDDGSGFALPDFGEPTVVSDAAAGASSLLLTGFLGVSLGVGRFFAIDDFLYRVASNDGGAVTFNPPLRAAVAAGAVAEVSAPAIRVRLAGKADWRPFAEYLRLGQPMTVRVVEAFDR